MSDLIMPETKDEASISSWHFEEGDLVEEGDDLVEIVLNSGDTFNLSAPASGILSEVLFDESDDVEIGDVLAIIEEDE